MSLFSLHTPSRALLLDSHPLSVGGNSRARNPHGLGSRHSESAMRFRRGLSRGEGKRKMGLQAGFGPGYGFGLSSVARKRIQQVVFESKFSLRYGAGLRSGAYQASRPIGLECLHFSRASIEANESNRRISCFLGNKFSSPSQGRKNRKQGRTYAREGKRGIKSRNVKVGLMYKLVQFRGVAGSGDGGADNGHGWGGGGGDGGGGGGGGGDGGDGGEGVNFPNSDEGGFSFFLSLLTLLRDRTKGGISALAVPAFLLGFLFCSLDLGDSNHAKAFSKPQELQDGEKRSAALWNQDAVKEKELAEVAVWEVKGSKWRRFIVDEERDEFLFDVVKPNEEDAEVYEQSLRKQEGKKLQNKSGVLNLLDSRKSLKLRMQEAGIWVNELVRQVFLPAGFPGSVTEGYMEFTSWRMGQIIASQISGVLTTQALLYAVGLGKGAIPTAAAVNWVLRDGIGYLSKILLSKYGRHFDVHPKGWRLVSDLIENASYGLELITPVVPHLFVYLAAAAGAGRSAAGLIQAATKSCFNANFAAQRNFAEIIAKGEAQGMASKSVGIGLGILISSYVGSQGPLLVLTFGVVSALHIFCNLKSYQAVHLRTLNPYRASLVLAEYLKSGNVPTIKDVSAEEPIFFGVPWFDPKPRRDQGKLDTVSPESKRVASVFEKNVELGVSLGAVVRTKGEADALMELYSKDKYLLAVKGGNHIKVVLKEGASPQDMLRAMVQAVYFLNFSSDRPIHSGDLVNDCNTGGILQVTHDLMENNFDNVTHVLSEAGWVSDGVLARAAPNRLLFESQTFQPLVGVKA
ncbi:unnamed protein product [Calypogeia fissa]